MRARRATRGWRAYGRRREGCAFAMTPAVSVIIPTHNRRAMLREALASVIAQRGASFEVIVVDDGSTDGTWDDLSAGAENIRTVRTARRGPAAARNHGIALARGDLIAFLDSDDLWMPEKLARQSAFMHRNSGCAISQTGETWLRHNRRVNPGRRHRKRRIHEPERAVPHRSPSWPGEGSRKMWRCYNAVAQRALVSVAN